MKQDYYIKIDTYGERDVMIINGNVMEQAERGENYLDPEEFMFLCEAESAEEAACYHATTVCSEMMDRNHP